MSTAGQYKQRRVDGRIAQSGQGVSCRWRGIESQLVEGLELGENGRCLLSVDDQLGNEAVQFNQIVLCG